MFQLLHLSHFNMEMIRYIPRKKIPNTVNKIFSNMVPFFGAEKFNCRIIRKLCINKFDIEGKSKEVFILCPGFKKIQVHQLPSN